MLAKYVHDFSRNSILSKFNEDKVILLPQRTIKSNTLDLFAFVVVYSCGERSFKTECPMLYLVSTLIMYII